MYHVLFWQTHPFAFQRRMGPLVGEPSNPSQNCQRVITFKKTVLNSVNCYHIITPECPGGCARGLSND